jgi:hypothetical protein
MGGQLVAPSASSACTVANIVCAMSDLQIDITAGNGKDVKMQVDGGSIVDFQEIMIEGASCMSVCSFFLPAVDIPYMSEFDHVVAKMAGMHRDDDIFTGAVAHAASIDRLAAYWLPLAGPTSSDDDREKVKGELLGELQKLDEKLSNASYLASTEMDFADIMMLPSVLGLFQYVLGEDVRGELGNVQAWIDRVYAEKVVSSTVGMLMQCCCDALYLFPHWLNYNHCGVTRCKNKSYIYH